ncbi:hypothetical protein D8M04_00730 [Oceanobacillus piezotolerans]|uniref:Uncharacterized protein n=1 Tax=Oceanobacillus piezotolerans TaxID=2448030 RepID=A0A498DF56_9BACI|nr:hypothetical protein [Oceanobacillus piezotolerans]RLL47838.1 hypothetical protein D8M04_00730 [Oceanobacillus piezotolerans]
MGLIKWLKDDWKRFKGTIKYEFSEEGKAASEQKLMERALKVVLVLEKTSYKLEKITNKLNVSSKKTRKSPLILILIMWLVGMCLTKDNEG